MTIKIFGHTNVEQITTSSPIPCKLNTSYLTLNRGAFFFLLISPVNSNRVLLVLGYGGKMVPNGLIAFKAYCEFFFF